VPARLDPGAVVSIDGTNSRFASFALTAAFSLDQLGPDLYLSIIPTMV
jgi:hypothetical protein